VVLGRKYLPHRFLLCRVRESRWTSIVESKHGRGFLDLYHDVGDLVWMDSRDFLDKREGFGMRDCFCVVKDVSFPLIASLSK